MPSALRVKAVNDQSTYDKIAEKVLQALKILTLTLASIIMIAVIVYGVKVINAVQSIGDEPTPQPVPSDPYWPPPGDPAPYGMYCVKCR